MKLINDISLSLSRTFYILYNFSLSLSFRILPREGRGTRACERTRAYWCLLQVSYRYVTGCDFLPIKQPKEVKLLSFNLAEQMPFMSNVRRINVDISRTTQRLGLSGDSFGRKGAARCAVAGCRQTVADG